MREASPARSDAGRVASAVNYAHLNRVGTPASRLIRAATWSPDEDIGQQSFITPRYLDQMIARLAIDGRSRLLDIGSGPGGPAVYLARAAGCRVTGIEISEEGVAAARELAARAGLGDRAEFVAADAMRMPFPDGRFDVAISLNAMNVFADKAALLREVRRVLAPDGTLAALTGTFDLPLDEAAAGAMSRGGRVPQHFDSLAGYRAVLAEAGFRVEEITEYVADFGVQVGRWAAAYRLHADAVAAEQGREAAERHIAYFETYARLIAEGRAANHLLIAAPA